MLDWVFGNKGKARKTGKRPSYEKAKEIAAHGSVEERCNVASHEDLEPELLYYLTADDAPEVRRRLARNDGTPLQADRVLANDVDTEVRCDLARKIGRLVPGLGTAGTERLTALAVEILEVLAQDHLPRVRAIVAEEIKLVSSVPRDLARKLARDVEEIVAAPILEYSPLLNAQDLLDTIAAGLGGGALQAVARRRDLEEPVATAVAEEGDVAAIKDLLGNANARISEEALDVIATVAAGEAELHADMVNRNGLPLRIVRRVAGFVSAALLDTLIARNDVADDTANELRRAVRQRIDRDDFAAEIGPDPEARAKQLFAEESLDGNAVTAAIKAKDDAFVRHALILLSELPPKVVARMLNAGSAKAATALCWKAGLDMAVAVALQESLGRIKPETMITPGTDGTFPLPDDELTWFVDYFNG
jgi:uncharacterized protein (DUF2336 family)